MVKISGAIGSGAAGKYFENEYSNARESYYLDAGGEGEKEQIQGVWHGRLAEELGLHGEVKEEDFKRLIEGQDPRDGKQLIRHVKSKTYTDRFGNEVKTLEHRAGRDIVLSCPDTFSLCAGPGGDQRIKQWQREAVLETLQELEAYVAGKNGKDGHYTGKMVTAIFQHDCARPDRKTGYAAPNLHDHAFTMNLTKDETGKYRAVEIDTLFKVRNFGTQLHWSKLAQKAMRGGYEIEVNPETGAPEIKGFSREYLAENSRRREEVLQNERKLKEEAADRGIEVDGPGLRAKAARMDRRSKKFDREEMKQRHLDLDAEYGHQARNAVGRALAREKVIQFSQRENPQSVREAVNYGIERALESEAVVGWASIQEHALWRGQAKVTYEQINVELGRRLEAGELIPINRGKGPEVTSRQMIQLEQDNVRRMKEGQGTARRICSPETVDQRINDAAERHLGFRLNNSQHQAVRSLLTTPDQIMGVQGFAGVGKTTTLKALKAVLEEGGYEVRGVSPQGQPAKLLAEAGIKSSTLQKFLGSNERPSAGATPRCYFLDEASLSDTKGMNEFLKRLRPVDRMFEVGDIKQHFAVNAGAPFKQHQQEGMFTAVIDDIQRQKDPGLKKVVELFAKGKPREATELLIKQGRVKEIEDPQERIKAIAKDYAASPNAIVVCPRNVEREEANQQIHSALQELGIVSQEDHPTTIYAARDVSGAARKVAASYRIGDQLRYNTGSKEIGIRAGEYREVINVDVERNRLTVMDDAGQTFTYDPKRLQGVAVYRKEERQFSVGDRVQFRAPFPEKRITTGEMAYVEKIDGDRFTFRMDDEKQKRVTFELPDYRHIDHGYAATSQGAQGLQAYRSILNASAYESKQILNERTGYVAESRAQHDVTIYTDSIKDLPYALARTSDKEIALDALRTTEERRDLIHQQRAAEIEQSRAREIPPTREKEIEQTQAKEIEEDRGYDRGGYGRSR